MKAAPAGTAVYLLCITEGEPFPAREGLHPLRPVYSLAHEDLVAVVCEVPLDEFSEAALRTRLGDASWLEREVRAHERAIEKVMERRTVLPMQFCTIFRTEEGVRALLESRREEFHRTLVRLREKEEWEVRMYFQPTPRAAREAATARAGLSGKEFLLKRRDETLQAWEEMREASRQAQRSFEKVLAHAEGIELKPIPPHDCSRNPKLIMDAVCLLARPRFEAFRRQLEELENELSGKGFRFRLTGPWPAYHFATESTDNVHVS